jgi:RNA-binding protein
VLTSKQRSYLAGLAAKLDPVVMVGKEGASAAVEAALKTELKRRELLKLRFQAGKDERETTARALADRCGAQLVKVIGNVAVFYRRADEIADRAIVLPT